MAPHVLAQDESLADDVDVPPEATEWTENEARDFFESGGAVLPPGPKPPAPPRSDGASEDYCMIRWAVDTSVWEPCDGEWKVLLDTLPEEDSTRVMRFHFKDDQKRALVSRLLQRCATALAGPFPLRLHPHRHARRPLFPAARYQPALLLRTVNMSHSNLKRAPPSTAGRAPASGLTPLPPSPPTHPTPAARPAAPSQLTVEG